MMLDPLQRRELPATPRDSAGWSAKYSLTVLVPDTSAPSAVSHTRYSSANVGLLGIAQPIEPGITASAGQFIECTGNTLLNAAFWSPVLLPA